MKTKVNTPDKTSGSPFRSRSRDSLAVQAKLFVNQPGDQHEAEADKAADSVVNGSSPTGTTAGSPAPVQLKPIAQTLTPTVQRKENPDQMGQLDIDGTEDKAGAIDYKGPVIQRKEDDSLLNAPLTQPETLTSEQNKDGKPSLQDQLKNSKGQGNPLPSDTKTEMESGFGADFSKVKTHTGTHAAEMNRSLGAQAFTNQGDIYFNDGKFDPASKDGKQLLAHELTHTIQQGAALPSNDKKVQQKGKKKEINSAEVAAAKNQAKNDPGMQQKTEKLVTDVVSKSKEQPAAAINSDSGNEQLPAKQTTEQEKTASGAAKEQENLNDKAKPSDEKGDATDQVEGQNKIAALDEAVEKEVSEKTKPNTSKEKEKTAQAAKPKEEKNDGDKKTSEEKPQKEEDPGPEGVKEDYDNPPPVKDAKVEEATDKVGESVGIDEEANVNIEGLIMTAQQFRDQGKESVSRAKTQTEHRLVAEKKMQEIQKKVDSSDKTLATAEKNTQHREKQIPKIMDRALATSKQRQEKVSTEVGDYTAEYNKNKGTANDLKKESADLNEGSKENSNPDEKESGELSSNYEEMSSGSATMAEGISGAGSTAAKLAVDAKGAKAKNAKTEKDLNESKANIKKSKQKISSEQNRNKEAKSKLKSMNPKFQASKNQEEQLTANGMDLMKTSFEMENETHRAQYFYYKDMKSIEGTDEMIMQEELKAQGELSNGPEALLFRYSTMKSEADKEAFLASLNEGDRLMLGMQLQAFNMNFEAWVEAKKMEFGERVEKRRANQIDEHNSKRNKGLEAPLNKATKNIDKISKSGLLWTSMTKSLEAMWEGLKNITWADVAKIGWAMVNPLETYKTIADAVSGIWTDLSDWKGFSEDPVGMILQKGSSVGVKLLTIAGVVTGLLLVLSIATGIAAVFFPPLWVVVGWLASATSTMASVTFWIGLITAALSLMSGIKNIYNVHTAKTAEEIFQGNHKLKQDAANTAAGVMGMVGAKSPPSPINAEKIGKFKNTVVRTWKASKGFVKGGVRKIPRLVGAAFKKETWTDLYASFKKFSAKKSDNLFGGNKKNIANKTDHVNDVAPKKVLKNADDHKVPSQTNSSGNFEKKLPEKKKQPDLDTKTSTKQADLDTDIPVTKNIPETKAPDIKKVDTDLPEANVNKMDTDLDTPKDRQVANGEKSPKSEILEDNPNLKDKELDNFKKYEDDVDPSTKKKMEEKADGDIEKGKNHKSKKKALVMARIITKTNDQLNTPIPVLLAELAPLKAMKGVEKFEAEGGQNGKFRIFMFGCINEISDSDGYDVNPENEGNDKEKTNDQTNNLDEAKEILENEWDVMTSNLKYDKGAHELAEEIGGVPQATFRNDPNTEYDAISDEFIGQHKPALKANIGSSFKKQAKRTFQVAKETGRKVIYRFDSEPAPEVIAKLNEYAARYGVELVIRF